MERAIAETDRRRERQLAHNLEHGIEPRSIVKAIQDVMEGARGPGARPGSRKRRDRRRGAARPAMSADQLAAEIDRLEKAMHRHARDLEFEEAARLRDEVSSLRQEMLELPEGVTN